MASEFDDPAHEHDMAVLRREQLAGDISREELDELAEADDEAERCAAWDSEYWDDD